MAEKQWTLIGQTVTDHIVVPKTATHDNITRNLKNANNDWTSIAKIITKYKIKDADKGTTHNHVIQRILDIKNGKITSLSQITGNKNSTNESDGNENENNNGEGSGESSSSSGDSGPLNSTVSKIPITDRQEAMDFALTEWNKIRRTSGHSLECQVFGSNHWQVGEWCKVYIPSLNEYVDMYISKIDNSNDSGSEWLTSITLMDYAPSISQMDEEDLKKAEEEEEGSSGSATGDSSGAEGGDAQSKWTEIAKILQDNYEKPSGGWNDIIQAVRDAKVYDPDIRNKITPLKPKTQKSYVQVGHELCDVVGISY